ncbi:MAG TPA: hypothetical protein VHK26_06270 [Methyloceanibacter sp.]|nr:hypothetical protein [Methyloceanibacter sp.]
MSIFRTILVSFVALAVAMLPLAGGFAAPNAHAVVVSAAPEDCCHDGKPCEESMPDCGSALGCMLKCSSVSAFGSAPFQFALTVSATERASFAIQRWLARAESPPPPPPRL